MLLRKRALGGLSIDGSNEPNCVVARRGSEFYIGAIDSFFECEGRRAIWVDELVDTVPGVWERSPERAAVFADSVEQVYLASPEGKYTYVTQALFSERK